MSMQGDSFSFCYFTMLAGFGNLNVLETVLVLTGLRSSWWYSWQAKERRAVAMLEM